MTLLRHFAKWAPKAPSRGLLRDCEIVAKIRCKHYSPYLDAGLDSIQNCKKVRLSIIIFTIFPARGLVQRYGRVNCTVSGWCMRWCWCSLWPTLRYWHTASRGGAALVTSRHITISIAIPMGGRLPPTQPCPPPAQTSGAGDNFCSNLVLLCSPPVLNICGVKKSVWGRRQMWLVGGGRGVLNRNTC